MGLVAAVFVMPGDVIEVAVAAGEESAAEAARPAESVSFVVFAGGESGMTRVVESRGCPPSLEQAGGGGDKAEKESESTKGEQKPGGKTYHAVFFCVYRTTRSAWGHVVQP